MSQRIYIAKYDTDTLFIDKNIINIFYLTLIMNRIFQNLMQIKIITFS